MKKRILTLLLALLCISLCACDSSDFGKAEKLFAQGDYQGAKEIYSTLGDYRDSADKVMECDYQIALRLFQEKDWEPALPALTALGEYKDALEKANECRYQIGKQAYESGDWSKAIEFLSDLSFSDRESMLASALREKGMTENADYSFLTDLETSVRYRMSEAENDTPLDVLIDTELSYIEKYRDLSFYDETLKELAQQYIRCL